jgi:hypothetical protein
MIKIKYFRTLLIFIAAVLLLSSCNSGIKTNETTQNDSIRSTVIDTSKENTTQPDTTIKVSENNTNNAIVKTELSKVMIYNFHVTNRCPSCIAIEDATTKTLNTYFTKEVKEGRIKRQILNVDDEANKTISEKYEAFGSGLFVTRVFKGKETTTDLTGDGFKYARNKEEKFIEILKTTITNYLK